MRALHLADTRLNACSPPLRLLSQGAPMARSLKMTFTPPWPSSTPSFWRIPYSTSWLRDGRVTGMQMFHRWHEAPESRDLLQAHLVRPYQYPLCPSSHRNFLGGRQVTLKYHTSLPLVKSVIFRMGKLGDLFPENSSSSACHTPRVRWRKGLRLHRYLRSLSWKLSPPA